MSITRSGFIAADRVCICGSDHCPVCGPAIAAMEAHMQALAARETEFARRCAKLEVHS